MRSEPWAELVTIVISGVTVTEGKFHYFYIHVPEFRHILKSCDFIPCINLREMEEKY